MKIARRVTFLTDYAEQADDVEFVIPKDLSKLSLDELQSLKSQATEHFDAVYADGSTAFTEDDIKLLSGLTEGIEALQAAIGEREAEAAQLASQAAELAARAKGEQPDAEDDPAPAAGDATVPDAGDASAALAVEPEAAKDDAFRINLSGIRKHTPRPKTEEPTKLGIRDVLKAMSAGQGFSVGQGLNWLEAGKLLNQQLSKLNESQYAAAARGGKHIRQEYSLLSIQKPIDPKLVIKSNDPMEIDEVLHYAMDEKRLPGNSLIASGGWCSPSETIYDLVELETRSGLFDLPEIGMARGGINRTLGPDFASLYADSGFSYTEAQDIAGNYGVDANGVGNGTAGDKPCYKVECPPFEEIRMGVMGLCITAGLLQSRGYPELLARVLRGALVAHDHKVAGTLVAQAVAGSTPVSMAYLAGMGVTAPLLEAIESQVWHVRYIHRLSDTATLEAVFPSWVKGAIRADMALRAGVDLTDVPDSRIIAWFRSRGVAPQFIYNWQDLGGAAGTFVKWPTEVKFLLYPAGTWVKGAADVINLTNVHDSVQLGNNDFTALFSEEGVVAAKMSHDSRVVTVPLCRNGATGSPLEIDCTTGGVDAA